jgi:hypothetical protein
MITSAANEHIKALRKLDQAKDRRASGNFLAEGLKVVGQAFDSDAHIHELLIAPELLISEYGRSLTELARKRDIPILELSPSVFAMLTRKEKPQGIAALIAQNWSDIRTSCAQPQSGHYPADVRCGRRERLDPAGGFHRSLRSSCCKSFHGLDIYRTSFSGWFQRFCSFFGAQH